MSLKLTKMFFIRHGQTEWNVAGRYQGHQDSPLSSEGIQQVTALARIMENFEFSHLYSSDLGRAHQTAKAIAERSGHDIITDERLRERKYGIFEGHSPSELASKYPDIYREYRQRKTDYAVPGGESSKAVLDRLIACIDEIAERHNGDAYVIVSHGGVINRFLRHVLGISQGIPRRFDIKNAAINIFVHNGQFWKLDLLGLQPANLPETNHHE